MARVLLALAVVFTLGGCVRGQNDPGLPPAAQCHRRRCRWPAPKSPARNWPTGGLVVLGGLTKDGTASRARRPVRRGSQPLDPPPRSAHRAASHGRGGGRRPPRGRRWLHGGGPAMARSRRACSASGAAPRPGAKKLHCPNRAAPTQPLSSADSSWLRAEWPTASWPRSTVVFTAATGMAGRADPCNARASISPRRAAAGRVYVHRRARGRGELHRRRIVGRHRRGLAA